MTCSRTKAILLVAGLGLLAPAAAAPAAAPLVVKMATLAPEGSTWHKALLDIGEGWKKASGGSVVLRIYPGGVVGDEGAMIRKIQVGQLHAAAITGMGLSFLDKSFYALSIPMFYASDGEFEYVREKVSPLLERNLAEKGYVVLFWGDAGWVRFFAARPFLRPGDVKQMKLFVGAGDETLLQLYKETGFNPVPLSAVDILQGLQTGLIDAFNTTPLAALAFQWFALAPHMADLDFARLPGATIIDRRTWEKIPADVRPKLLAASREGEKRLRTEIRKLNDDAVKAMVAHGLKVIGIPPDTKAEWRKMIEDLHPRIRGRILPAETFDAVLRFREEYRGSGSSGKTSSR